MSPRAAAAFLAIAGGLFAIYLALAVDRLLTSLA